QTVLFIVADVALRNDFRGRVLVGVFQHRLVGHLGAFCYRVSDLRGEQANRTECVVVAGDHIIYFRRIAVRIHHRNHWNSQLARFLHRNLLLVGVDNEESVGQTVQILDAGKVRLQVLALALQLDDFFLREQLVTAIRGHLVEFFQPLHRLLDGHPVGEQSTEPALVDVEHAAALRLFGDGILCLALGTDKQNQLALGSDVGDELGGLLEHLQGLLQVDNVNPVALAKDVFLHLRVPALGLMPEVNTCFEQLLHGDVSQTTSYLDCIPRGGFSPDRSEFPFRNPPRCGGCGTNSFRYCYVASHPRNHKTTATEPDNSWRPTLSCGQGWGTHRFLTLRELEALTCTLLAVLLAFLHARVASEEAFGLHLAAEFRVEELESAGEAHADCIRLAMDAATADICDDI